jgi:uncharacterized membrane protein
MATTERPASSAASPFAGLPGINRIGLDAPLRWLAGGWGDLWKAPGPCLVYGAAVAAISAWLTWLVMWASAGLWIIPLLCGFVFLAPMLAMGLYEAGRRIEAGERPTLGQVLFVKSAVRVDVAYLGLILLLLFFIWGDVAQILYGLTTRRLAKSLSEVVTFALGTPEGHRMMITGSLIGGAIAWLSYCIVVVSAPMLLERDSNFFVATITSVRAVARNLFPMAIWALLIVALCLVSMATAYMAFVVVFPTLGLASWRAYRDLVQPPRELAAASA